MFILVDGFGMNFVEAMDDGAFAPQHLAGELQTVFPSTTSATLTTLATAAWPVEHAVVGWFLYLPEVDAVTMILPFIRRSDGRSLTELGVDPDRAFPQRPVVSLFQRGIAQPVPRRHRRLRLLHLLHRRDTRARVQGPEVCGR